MSDLAEFKTCENCRWWDNSTQLGTAQADTTGLCRASAPIVNWQTGAATWPFTEDTDWCAMLSPIPAPPAESKPCP